jgi:hypothetical protein
MSANGGWSSWTTGTKVVVSVFVTLAAVLVGVLNFA